MTIELLDDLLTPAALHDPHPYFAALRENDPVHWSDRHSAWLVTGFEQVVAAYSEPALSSDRIRPLLARATANLSVDAPADDGLEVLQMMSEWMVVSDKPAHTRLRRLVAPAFRPAQVNALTQKIDELSKRFLDEFVMTGAEDYVANVAFPLPAAVIAELLGAPAADRDLFREWSEELALVAFGTGGEARDDRRTRALHGLRQMMDYFSGLIEEVRRHPGDNLISALVATVDDDDALTEAEIQGMCALMLFAGHETTTNLIGTQLMLLLQHPEQLERVRSEPSLCKQAVEEALRFDGPIKILHRWVTDDVELDGRQLLAGQRVLLCQSAANRDPRKFPRAEEFDVSRELNPHVAFGKGIHTCIGAQLSRLESQIVLDRTLHRLPGLRLLDDELAWHPSLAARGLIQLRVNHNAPRSPG